MVADRKLIATLWDPIRDRGTSRLLFIARLSMGVRLAIEVMYEDHCLGERFGDNAFPLDLLHQSVSDRYVDTAELREKLLRAGDAVHAAAFTLVFDFLHSAKNEKGSYNWEVRSRSKFPELKDLVAAINAAIEREGLPQGCGHSPHLTLCYSAADMLVNDEPITPIEWTIDAFELVVGEKHKGDYVYTPLRSWSLGPEAPRAVQANLF